MLKTHKTCLGTTTLIQSNHIFLRPNSKGLWNDISCVQTKIGVCDGCQTSDGSGAVCKKTATETTIMGGSGGGASVATTPTTTTTTTTTTTKAPQLANYPSGWEQLGDKCYKVENGDGEGIFRELGIFRSIRVARMVSHSIKRNRNARSKQMPIWHRCTTSRRTTSSRVSSSAILWMKEKKHLGNEPSAIC